MNRTARRFTAPLSPSPIAFVGATRRSFVASVAILALSVAGCATVNEAPKDAPKESARADVAVYCNGRDVASLTLLESHHALRAMIEAADRSANEADRRNAWAMVNAADVVLSRKFGTVAIEGDPHVYRANWNAFALDFATVGVPGDQIAEFARYVFA